MLKIKADRLHADLNELAQIGATPDGGVSRPALSDVDVQGRAWLQARIEAAGLDYRRDGAGNQSAVLPSADPNAKTILFGSHIDTVPNGGRFDGALGTLTALEAVRTIKEAGLNLPVHLEIISFTDEEGSLIGLLGSQAFTGILTADKLAHPRGGVEKLGAGLQRLGLTHESVLSARRDPANLLAFVELHVEQGTRLEQAGLDIGVVTAIVGIRSYQLTFTGQAAHAGTMPMDQRQDALWGASAFVQRARDLIMREYTPGVVNCGDIMIQPGAFNIVPAEVKLALEFRNGDDALLDHMERDLIALAEAAAHEYRLGFSAQAIGSIPAAQMDERVVSAIEHAADTLNLTHTRLLSFAGHDTQSLATILPSAMFFVPSVDGISHNPKEYTPPADVENGANTLLHTVLHLAETMTANN